MDKINRLLSVITKNAYPTKMPAGPPGGVKCMHVYSPEHKTYGIIYADGISSLLQRCCQESRALINLGVGVGELVAISRALGISAKGVELSRNYYNISQQLFAGISQARRDDSTSAVLPATTWPLAQQRPPAAPWSRASVCRPSSSARKNMERPCSQMTLPPLAQARARNYSLFRIFDLIRVGVLF